MVPIIFTIYGVVLLIILALSLQIWSKNKRVIYLILPLISAALAYDNFIIASGNLFGEGATLQSLNSVRYITHALLTPLLSLYALRLCRNAGLSWSWKKGPATAVAGLVILLIAMGVYVDIVNLQLEPAAEMGTLRYVNEGFAGPPVPAIITIIILISMGVSLAVRTRWIWLLLGAIIMFVVSAAAASNGVLTNLAEILLLVSLAATARHFPHLTRDSFRQMSDPAIFGTEKEPVQV